VVGYERELMGYKMELSQQELEETHEQLTIVKRRFKCEKNAIKRAKKHERSSQLL
jgi:hypothetical protein